jgi:outer membrane biosynthesis protein TonB
LRTDWTISACCHAVVLGAALVSFSPARLPATHIEAIPVNIVTDTTLSQVPRGQTHAPKEAKNPFAERVGEQQLVDNPAAKVSKKEVTASTDATPPPTPPQPKQEAKAKSEPKRDLIAEALKKDAAATKAEHKKAADAKVPTPPKRPPQPPQPQNQPKFDPREMQALLDKRTALRKEATNTVTSDEPSIGAARAKGAQLSQNELDALMARLQQLWDVPAGARNPEEITVIIRVRLKKDGSLADGPRVMSTGRTPLYEAARDSAVRAILRGAPFTMLRPETYESWKEIDVTFDPRFMVGGG